MSTSFLILSLSMLIYSIRSNTAKATPTTKKITERVCVGGVVYANAIKAIWSDGTYSNADKN